MKNMLHKAQEQFRDIQVLLNLPQSSQEYYTNLSIATEEAYFTMNSEMCMHADVFENCLDHRNFIRSMMDVLGELEEDSSTEVKYKSQLSEFSEHVNTILERISIALAA
ncbi:MAG: hypothetical protein PHW18_04615 [Sulfuricurvum sp.]|uniref:hypothetical protein n=1 Tax=Sulfuricurvum sp. TaxID=2025608 RepID=UPI00262F3CF4|nr:hypothetical protein [Sulfuricurvum sp.]MDD2828838.1 hypothetical protein [Sulfuricurvum sp.]MDD4948703.1 hypothetical protein [Sulfuricurvum sp.]